MLFAVFAMLLLMQARAQQTQIDFEKYTLPNGLTVILYPDNTVPLVAVSVLYKVGSKDEDTSQTGFAHFFEHLLFDGSANVKRGDFDNFINGAGGTNNANTSFDRTYYYDLLPSNQVELGLWLESDRMMSTNITPEGLETQRQVVKEEKRLNVDNQPYGTLFENAFKYTFESGPYSWMPIGSMEHLDAAQTEDFRAFFRKYYAPNNAILSIAGDINVPVLKQQIEKYFGPIPAGPPIQRNAFTDKPINGEVRKVVYDNIQLPAIVQVYKGPAQGTPDYYAFNVLGTYLSDGSSSVMNKVLKDEKQQALMATTFPYSLVNTGVFINYTIANIGVQPEILEKSIDSIMMQVRNNLIAEKDMQKIITQIETQFVRRNSSVAGIAETLADYEAFFGDANLINTEIERYRQVTREDIRNVARKYLNPGQRVVLYYLPKSEAPAKP